MLHILNIVRNGRDVLIGIGHAGNERRAHDKGNTQLVELFGILKHLGVAHARVLFVRLVVHELDIEHDQIALAEHVLDVRKIKAQVGFDGSVNALFVRRVDQLLNESRLAKTLAA